MKTRFKSFVNKTKEELSMKKLLALMCAAVLVFTFSACGKNSKYAGKTVTGKITKISNGTVTVTLGELSENEQDAPEKPDGEQPGDNSSDNNGSTPPQKPDGDGSESGNPKSSEESSSDNQNKTPPEKPSGDEAGGSGNTDSNSANNGQDGNGGTPPQMPSGNGTSPDMAGSSKTFTAGKTTLKIDISDASIVKNSEAIEVSDLSKGDVLQITFDSNGDVKTVIVVIESGSGSGTVEQGDSANTITEDGTYKDKTYDSDGDDENALRLDGAEVTLDGITVNKSGGSSSNVESGDFYGMNAAVLATNGANVTIKNAKISSNAQNGNGVFSYGEGTVVNISDSEITTKADNSGGIQTTGGGTTNATNLTVTTNGNSSAAIRSDRGGGTVNVKKGSYTSNGYNSPAVYSTADITVSDATLTANNSETLVIEGKNSIKLNNCTVTGNMSDTKGSSSSENVHNVMIYQSMSGDADVGTSEFSMNGGSLVSNNGDMFYVTNTACKISLSGVEIKNNDNEAYLMRICGNSAARGWGTAGSNGAQVEFTADSQTLSGNIIVDSISTLNMTFKGNSTFTGTINITENNEKGTAVSDNAVITLESGSVWNLTGNCSVTSISGSGTINFNGYTVTLADGTVLRG